MWGEERGNFFGDEFGVVRVAGVGGVDAVGAEPGGLLGEKSVEVDDGEVEFAAVPPLLLS